MTFFVVPHVGNSNTMYPPPPSTIELSKKYTLFSKNYDFSVECLLPIVKDEDCLVLKIRTWVKLGNNLIQTPSCINQ